MEIFERIEDRGYPADYLLSRVRSRSVLYKDFIAGKSDIDIWRCLLCEYHWIYIQMNGALRDIFRRVFIYSELRTIFMCLRYKKVAQEGIEKLLCLSLLSNDLKELLKGDSDMITAIGGIEGAFLSISERFRGLKEVFIKDGLKGFEQALKNIYLEDTINSKLHNTIRDFFAYIIDSRNIIAVYKHIRWHIHDYPLLINGGNVKEARLRRIFESQDISGIITLVQKLTGITTEVKTFENSLLKGIKRFLRKTAKDPLCIGVILAHLWRCYTETIDTALAFCRKESGRDGTIAEMIH